MYPHVAKIMLQILQKVSIPGKNTTIKCQIVAEHLPTYVPTYLST